MASTGNKLAYETTAQLACGIASLATGSSQESASLSNTTNLDFGMEVTVCFTIASGSPSTTGPAVNVYAAGSLDGTLWPIIQISSGATKALSGTDNALGALGSPPNLYLIGSFGIQTTSSNGQRTFRTEPFSVAAAFPDGIPKGVSIIVENQTGVAFSTSTATTANFVQVGSIFSTSGN